MPRPTPSDHRTRTPPPVSSPDLAAPARRVASLALERVRRNGTLSVRQREELRRTLAEVATVLCWDLVHAGTSERVARASQDLAALAEVGAGSLEEDLKEHISAKGTEIRHLEELAADLQRMAADSATRYPTTLDYSRTARDSVGRLVTRTETLTLTSGDEARRAAATLEKGLEGWRKLRDQMVADLKEQKREVGGMRLGLPDFVESYKGVVGEVIAILN